MTKHFKWLTFTPYLIWMVLFIIVPLLLLIYYSFIDINGNFSLANYKQVFSPNYLTMFKDSLLYAFMITVCCLVVSFPLAYFLVQSKHQQLLLLLIIMPTWMNLLLKTYAFIGIFSHDGIINRFLQWMHVPALEILFHAPSFIIVASYIYLPFMLLPIYNHMNQIPDVYLKAANDLGANKWVTFTKIIMPLTKEGVRAGVQVTFIPALSLFMITRLITGNKVITIGTAIEEQFLVIQNYGIGATIAIVLIVLMFIILNITKSSKESKEV
ncbi:ABC transporter permease [Staphylococcus massiliensis CCUG 55927]|uniref:ABC transporter permease n=1 Tax=Staphylococcus massiliensis TaxID=555791 RepID=UPI0002D6618A|nr:ABC transporter permease [Staphylococcus massiliensis]POA01292.1 ABC transporter permease [Staphylococcus massiliensis CCUG 55927]